MTNETNSIERTEATITLNGETRTLMLEREAGETDWRLPEGVFVIYRYPKGNKNHVGGQYHATLYQANGHWHFNRFQDGWHKSNGRATVVRFATDEESAERRRLIAERKAISAEQTA